ncbi:hypothetical protein A2154_00560 [Candidatus Gottesmanbacteria bacterium RBG_16_43_7]|uniref:Nudix hydrolase domain-containing protein n=1 Tax=Candidatus Gottesmanbacteria bacterium RBG_16_43_7 TaxID=1798373 RepID=A0A1F5Z831_9BACT|nr:MAG: hypothetical protein A2154_00560 [Candidatus Gottesmanbacteria bacterium RBG_16_43_7]
MKASAVRFKMIGSSYLILIRGRRILLSRRFNTGYEDGKYSLPAGHVEAGETLTQTLVREIKEEIGIKIDDKTVRLVHVMHRKENDIRMDYFFTSKSYSGKIINCEPEKCSDLSWFPIKKLPGNTILYIRHAIVCLQKNIWYSEFGWKEN